MKNEIAGVNVTDEIVARYPESQPEGRRGRGHPACEGSHEAGGGLRGRILFFIPVQQGLYVGRIFVTVQ